MLITRKKSPNQELLKHLIGQRLPSDRRHFASEQDPAAPGFVDIGRIPELAFRTLKLSGHKNGGSLFARRWKRDRQAPLQLLLGHYDTVWPIGTLKDMPFEVDGNRLFSY
jgi:hypothetical protein